MAYKSCWYQGKNTLLFFDDIADDNCSANYRSKFKSHIYTCKHKQQAELCNWNS